MDTLDSVQSDAPTSLATDAVDAIPMQTPDVKIDDMFDAYIDGSAVQSPEEPSVDAQDDFIDSLEVSEDVEQALSEDDSNIDTPEEGEEVESSEEGTPDSVVGWDEMQDHTFEIGGKAYTANDLKASLGRQAKQEEARKEVETATQELNANVAKFESDREALQIAQSAGASSKHLEGLKLQYSTIENQRQQAIQASDGNALALLDAQVKQLTAEYNKVETQVKDSQAKQAATAATKLADFGLGELNTDIQRQEAFRDYAFKTIPTGLVNLVNTNPELMAFVEKARLYDKSKENPPKAILKGQKRSLKGGAARTPRSAPTKDAISAKTDNMFKSFT